MENDEALGLRERKKRRTRLAIVRAAFELVLESGYDGATIARIAERADVAPRTIHTIFAGKDEIVLWHADDHLDRLERHLAVGRGPVLGRVLDWVREEADRASDDDDGITDLRDRAYAADPHMQALEYGVRKRAEQMISEAELAHRGTTGLPDELAAEALGAAIMRMLLGLAQRAEDGAAAIGSLEVAVERLRATLETGPNPGGPGERRSA